MTAPSRLYASVADRAYASPLHWSHEPDAYRPPHDGLSVADRRYLCDVAELTEAVEIHGADVYEDARSVAVVMEIGGAAGHESTIATTSDSRHVNRTSEVLTVVYDSEATS